MKLRIKLLGALLLVLMLPWSYVLGGKTCAYNYELQTYEQKKTYYDAKTTCENYRGYLAKISSLTMTNAIMKILGSGYYYIGLKLSGSTYYWHDRTSAGGSWSYNNWESGYGNGSHECVVANGRNQAKWQGRPCDSAQSYVCQKQIDPLPSLSSNYTASLPKTGDFEVLCSVPQSSTCLTSTVTWYLYGIWSSERVPTSSTNVYQEKSTTSSQAISKLVFRNADIYHARTYSCRVSNGLQSGRYTSVTVSVPPVINEISTANCSSQLNVSWTPHARASGLYHMLKVYPISGTSLGKEIKYGPLDNYNATVNDLLPSSYYIVAIFACKTSACSWDNHRTGVKKLVTTGGISNPVMYPKMTSNGQNCDLKWDPPDLIVAEIKEYMITATKSYHKSRNELLNVTERYTAPYDNHTFAMEPNIKYDIIIQAVTCAGPGKAVQASGLCAGPPYAPDKLERPLLTQSINGTNITITIPTEAKGLISCIFVVCGDDATSSTFERYVRGTLQVPGDSFLFDQHILKAIRYSRIAGNGSTTVLLGDGSSSFCNLFDTGYNNIESDSTKNLVVMAKNNKLYVGASNRVYVIATVPYKDKVFLRRSEDTAVRRNWETTTTATITSTTTVGLLWETTDEYTKTDKDVHLIDARYLATVAIVVPLVLISLGLGYRMIDKRVNASKKASELSSPVNKDAASGMSGASSSSITPGGHRGSETLSGYTKVDIKGAYEECKFNAGQDTQTSSQYEECLPVLVGSNPPIPTVPRNYTPMKSQNSNPQPLTSSAYEDCRL